MSGFAKWMASACCWSSSPQPRLVIFINFVSLSLSFCWPIAPWLITSWWSDGQDPHPIAFTACANIIHFDSINTIVLFAMTPAKCIQYGMWILGFYCFRRAQSIKTRRRRLSFVPRPARRRSALPETAFWLFLVVSSSSSPHSLRHRLFRLERDSVSDVTPTGRPPFSRRGSASTASGDSPERKWCWHAQNQRFFSFSLFLARLSVRRERPFSLLEEVGHRIGDVYRSSFFFSFDVASATFPSSDDDFYWISYTTPPTTSSSVARISNRILPLYAVIQRCPAPVQLCNNPPPPAARYRITPLVKYLLPLIATSPFLYTAGPLPVAELLGIII